VRMSRLTILLGPERLQPTSSSHVTLLASSKAACARGSAFWLIATGSRWPRVSDQGPKISRHEHFKRCMICSTLAKVALCWPFTRRNRVEGEIPSFFENSLKELCPRFSTRNVASLLSRVGCLTRRYCKLNNSGCGIFSLDCSV
jgi:hypothetical protein